MAAIAPELLKRPLYVYDLPPELLQTIQLRLDAAPHGIEDAKETLSPKLLATSSQDLPPATNTFNGETPKTNSCNLCSLTFPNVVEQRNHVRSDLHTYNVKQRMRGGKPVSEQDFEKLVSNIDESLSGSESSESDSESDDGHTNGKNDESRLSALFKRQANVDDDDEEEFGSRKKVRGAGKPPLIWYQSAKLPRNTSLGIYRSLFSKQEQEQDLVKILKQKQLSPAKPEKPATDDEGGVPLPQPPQVGPHIFLCMIGGGHFAAMIVSLTPQIGKKSGMEERQASVIAHKTFHRYTTRRKQGGAQSSNDMAKGAAHSAGASIRRYNEEALIKEVRELLDSWRSLINTSDLVFIRATGSTNRRTLFGPYDGQVLTQTDARIRGFPFSTRRATQAELMRCFVELTGVKIQEIDLEAEALARSKEKEEQQARLDASTAAAAKKAEARAKPALDPATEEAILHTTQLQALIRRSKAPGLASYITSNALTPDFSFHPPDSQAHHHTPTPLHMATSLNSPALISVLLVKLGADPGVKNGDGKTAFELAGDRAARDAFRLARGELGEGKWKWDEAGVPEPLSKSEVSERAEREKAEAASAEAERRKGELARLEERETEKEKERKGREEAQRDRKMGKGVMLGEKQTTAEERREEEARGMTPEMRMRLEREKRARAAEERMRRMAGATGGGGR